MSQREVALMVAIVVFAVSIIAACDDFHAVGVRNDLSRPILANFREIEAPGEVVRESKLPPERIEPGARWGPVSMGDNSSDVYFFIRWADPGELLGCVHVDLTRYKTSDKIIVLASSAEPCPEGSTR